MANDGKDKKTSVMIWILYRINWFCRSTEPSSVSAQQFIFVSLLSLVIFVSLVSFIFGQTGIASNILKLI